MPNIYSPTHNFPRAQPYGLTKNKADALVRKAKSLGWEAASILIEQRDTDSPIQSSRYKVRVVIRGRQGNALVDVIISPYDWRFMMRSVKQSQKYLHGPPDPDEDLSWIEDFLNNNTFAVPDLDDDEED